MSAAERRAPSPLSRLAPTRGDVTAVGIAVLAASVFRLHALTAGADPGVALPGTALVLLGLAAGSARPCTGSLGVRWHAVAAAVTAAGAAVLLPIPLGVLTGWPAACATAVALGVPSLLAARALPGLVTARSLVAAGPAVVAAGAVGLPYLGPGPCGTLAAFALLAPAARARPGRRPAGTPEAWSVAPAAWLAACTVAWTASAAARPWPAQILAAGSSMLALGAATRAVRPGVRFIAVAGAVAVLVPWHAPAWPALPEMLVDAPSRPIVGAAWGLVALLVIGLVHGLGAGVASGLAGALPVADPASPGRLALAGTALLVAPALLRGEPAGEALGLGLVLVLGTLASPRAAARVPAPAFTAGLAVVAAAVAALGGSWAGALLRPDDATRVLQGPGWRLERRVRQRPEGGEDVTISRDGRPEVVVDAARLPDDLLSGHLAGLLAPRLGTVLVAGAGSGRVLDALDAHGFAKVLLHDTDRAARELLPPPGREVERATSPSPAGWLRAGRGLDAIVCEVDDPTRATSAPFWTARAFRTARELLAPRGVLVQRLDVGRLGPEGLLAAVRLLEETFPSTWLVSADHARDGVVLAVSIKTVGTEPEPLDFSRIELRPGRNPRLTEPVRASLARALLIKPSDLLLSVVSGPRGLAALEPGVAPLDPWSPGREALEHAAPEVLAVELTRALLFARLQHVELEVSVAGAAATPPATERWPFLGVETALGTQWRPPDGLVRMENVYVTWAGTPGIYREASRRMTWERDEGRLTVTEVPRTRAGRSTLSASIRSFMDQDVRQTGFAAVHGHEAAWIFREPSLDHQVLHLTWHCPVQGRLYVAEYALDDGLPGMHAEPLDALGRAVWCDHEPPP